MRTSVKSGMTFLAFVVTLFPRELRAGNELGNGGDAVVCRDGDGEIASVELFDFYEARLLRDIMPAMGGTALSVDQKVTKVLERLAKFTALRSERYQDWFATFYQEARFVTGITLPDIPDTDSVILPSSCEVEQIAVQKDPEIPGDKRYVINKDLWDRMDDDNKSGLFLHELVYRDFIAEGHESSVFARYFNSVACSNFLETATTKGFVDLVRNSRLKSVDIGGLNFDLSSDIYFRSNAEQLISGRLFGENSIRTPAVAATRWSRWIGVEDFVSFYPSGALSTAKLTASYVLQIGGKDLFVDDEYLKFHENGFVQEVSVPYHPRMGQIAFSGPNAKLHLASVSGERESVDLELDDAGLVTRCSKCAGTAEIGSEIYSFAAKGGKQSYSWGRDGLGYLFTNILLAQPSPAVTPHGRQVYLAEDTVAAFNENGEVEAGELLHTEAFSAQGQQIFAATSPCYFQFLEGNFIEVWLDRPADLKFDNGRIERLEAGSFVQFNDSGLVTRADDSYACPGI